MRAESCEIGPEASSKGGSMFRQRIRSTVLHPSIIDRSASIQRRSFTCAVIVASALLSPGASFAEDWSGSIADEPVSFDDDQDARGVQLQANNSGVTAFWVEDVNGAGEIHYGAASSAGPWSSESGDRQLSFSDGHGVFEEPSIAFAFQSRIVVWSEVHQSAREIHFGISTDSDAHYSSESADLLLSDPASAVDAGVPSVVTVNQQAIHVVWAQAVNGVSEVHYSRSLDGGATWSGMSGDRVISHPDGHAALAPRIVVGASNRLLVLWREESEAGGSAVHLGISTNGGTTWSSEAADREITIPASQISDLDVTVYPSISARAELVIAASFDPVAPYHHEVYHSRSTNNGATWSGESALTPVSFDEDHTRSAFHPALFHSGCAGAVVVWDEVNETSGTSEIHVSRQRGTGEPWSGATADRIVSFPDGESGERPSITGFEHADLPSGGGRGDDVGDTWIAWTEVEDGAVPNAEVHISKSAICTGATSAAPEGASIGRLPTLEVFPNPTHGPIHLKLAFAAAFEPVRLELIDASGRVVRRAIRNMDSDGRGELDWSVRTGSDRPLSFGVYLLRAQARNGSAGTPIVAR